MKPKALELPLEPGLERFKIDSQGYNLFKYVWLFSSRSIDFTFRVDFKFEDRMFNFLSIKLIFNTKFIIQLTLPWTYFQTYISLTSI